MCLGFGEFGRVVLCRPFGALENWFWLGSGGLHPRLFLCRPFRALLCLVRAVAEAVLYWIGGTTGAGQWYRWLDAVVEFEYWMPDRVRHDIGCGLACCWLVCCRWVEIAALRSQ